MANPWLETRNMRIAVEAAASCQQIHTFDPGPSQYSYRGALIWDAVTCRLPNTFKGRATVPC